MAWKGKARAKSLEVRQKKARSRPIEAKKGKWTVQWSGLKELQRDLRAVDKGLADELKDAGRIAADYVLGKIEPRTPRGGSTPGTLISAMKAKGMTNVGTMTFKGGGRKAQGPGGVIEVNLKKAPHFFFREFGGEIRRFHSRSKTRGAPHTSEGYFFFPTVFESMDEVRRIYQSQIDRIFDRYLH